NQITIGSSQGLAQNWLPKIIYDYRQKHPEIEAKLEIFDNLELLEQAVAQNNIDLGFSEVISSNQEITRRNIASVKYSLIVALDSPLAQKNWYSLTNIKQKPLVLLSDRFASRRVFESRLAELDLKLTDFSQVETVDTISLLRTYLVRGNYLGFASDLELQAELDAKVLTAVNLQEFALPADIYVSFANKTIAKDNSTSVAKFLALFPNNTPRSPIFTRKIDNAEETITINLGVQNGTIPTITAGLILQRLRLLEQFLPRTGRYASVKYDLQWHNFLSGMPIAEGLRDRQLDIGVLGDYPLLQSAVDRDRSRGDRPTQLVSFVSIDPHGDGNAVIVPQTSKLETIADLKGATVAIPVGSSAHGMLLRTLSDLDLLSQVQLFPLKNSHFRIPSQPRIAAGFAYFSPFHQLASDRGNFKYLSDEHCNQLPGFYGVVVSQSFARKYPEIIVSYLQAAIAAQNWLSNTPSALSLVSKWTKVKPQILEKILGSSFFDRTPSSFRNDWQIRSDWVSSHIDRLQSVPQLEKLQEIQLDRWIQPEFLQTARQN
ncbi:ABC transporter substrate-binding protein, partial [Pleurocapsales cyanobacterium LEGE 10410]|nr:ABC transporter substrate-binding protein [Pleurocapsales cyanobacterium LEGE 10410]